MEEVICDWSFMLHWPLLLWALLACGAQGDVPDGYVPIAVSEVLEDNDPDVTFCKVPFSRSILDEFDDELMMVMVMVMVMTMMMMLMI